MVDLLMFNLKCHKWIFLGEKRLFFEYLLHLDVHHKTEDLSLLLFHRDFKNGILELIRNLAIHDNVLSILLWIYT